MLVWQDFLFACAAYPEDASLADEVDAEARDNVARLMPHPSLVLWNGNNENIWGYGDWGWQPAIGGRPWGLGYYLDVLPRAVAETDPTRPYWPGSPYSGSMDIHPNDDDHALRHIWDVWNEVDYTVYRTYRPRFVAEFGWQGPPTWATLTRAISDDPLTPTSPGMLHHQKADDGHGKLARGLLPHFGAAPDDVTDWHWATQLNQARAVALRRGALPIAAPALHGHHRVAAQRLLAGDLVGGDRRRRAQEAALVRPARRVRPAAADCPAARRRGLALFAVNDTLETWDEPVAVRRLTFDGTVLAEEMLRGSVGPLGAATIDLPVAVARRREPACRTAGGSRTERGCLGSSLLRCGPRARPGGRRRCACRCAARADIVVLTLSAETVVRDVCVFPDRIAPAAEADDALVDAAAGRAARNPGDGCARRARAGAHGGTRIPVRECLHARIAQRRAVEPGQRPKASRKRSRNTSIRHTGASGDGWTPASHPHDAIASKTAGSFEMTVTGTSRSAAGPLTIRAGW